MDQSLEPETEEDKDVVNMTNNSDEKHTVRDLYKTQPLKTSSSVGEFGSPKNRELKAKYITTLSARNSANASEKSIITPRAHPLDDSSNSDMQELKMALGGVSDRSGSGQQNTFLNNLFEGNDVIFSDEGSGDSFDLDDQQEHEQEEKVWHQAEFDNRASLKLMRAQTKEVDQYDELDWAIRKIRASLVNEVITDNFSAKDGKDSFTKLERRNAQLIHELATCTPFVKVAAGKYFIGTEIRQIQIKGRGVLVKTGGGFMYLLEFLLHYAKSESLRIGLNMLK